MAIDDIVEVLDDPECTISDVELEADNWTDSRKAKRLQSTGRQDGNSFNAVGIVKQKTDTKDEFYIYRINNSKCNDGRNYVFKSSRKMIELALKMDIDGDDNIMQTENAYFDATHSRVHGFKSFGLWVYHPSMWRILCLASMEIQSENSQDIAQFFKLFNELVMKVLKTEGKMFNPRFFMCDKGGANHEAIRIVYSDEFAKTRVVGCQWHFKNDASRIAKRIGPDMQEMFIALTKELCKVTTVAKYKILKSRQD